MSLFLFGLTPGRCIGLDKLLVWEKLGECLSKTGGANASIGKTTPISNLLIKTDWHVEIKRFLESVQHVVGKMKTPTDELKAQVEELKRLLEIYENEVYLFIIHLPFPEISTLGIGGNEKCRNRRFKSRS